MLRSYRHWMLMILCLITRPSPGVSQWVPTIGLDSGYVSTIYSNGQYLLAGDYFGAHRSSDNGLTWTLVDSGFVKYPFMTIGPGVSGFLFRNGKMYAGTNNGLYVSTNNGTSWVQWGSVPNNASLANLLSYGSDIIADGGWDVNDDDDIAIYSNFFRSTDEGATWTDSSAGLPSNQSLTKLVALAHVLVVSTNFGIYVSRDSGLTWNKSTPYESLSQIFQIAASDSVLVAVSRGPLSLSTDGGATWTFPAGDSTFVDPLSMCIVRNTLVLASIDSGITLSTDWGITWKRANEGLDTTSSFSNYMYTVHTLLPVGDFLFAVQGQRLWRRPLSEITSAPSLSHAPVPSRFSLDQNFPNPFNPSTVISYQLAVSSHVTLKVYDILGREVTTLVDENKSAGSYQVKFDGSHCASGIYFYRLEAGTFPNVKKFVLLK